MKTMKKIFILICMLFLFPVNNTFAKNNSINTISGRNSYVELLNDLNVNQYESISVVNSTDYFEIYAKSSVAIFFGGMVVGWLIGGAIKYATGQSPEEWVDTALEWLNEPRIPLYQTKSITISNNTVSSYKTVDGNECIRDSNSGVYYCVRFISTSTK